jgi:hypothetical protein
MSWFRSLLNIFSALFVLCPFLSFGFAETVDRIIAFVDDEAITLTELEAAYGRSMEQGLDMSREEVLNAMINRFLLFREATRLRLEASDEESLLNEYINMKVAAFISIRENEIREFYDKNRKDFGDARFFDVRDRIEQYLLENEVNIALERHIEELRSKSYIRILLE